MKNQKIITICGDPHSGKSVLYRAFYKLLPQKYMVNLSACPDGEGMWSGNENQKQVQLLRRKGSFSNEFIERRKKEIDEIDAPILFCDIGGIPSEENKRICEKVNMAIILYKNEETLKKWRAFCEECNIQIIAEVKSVLSNEKDISEIESSGKDETTIKGTLYNLQREKQIQKMNDPLVKLMAEFISNDLIKNAQSEQIGKRYADKSNVLNMRIYAEENNLVDEHGNINWNPSVAENLYFYCRGFSNASSKINLYEARATWVAALVCEAAVDEGIKDIALYDMRSNSYIETKELKKDKKEPKNVNTYFSKYELLDDKLYLYTIEQNHDRIVHLEINPEYKLNPKDLDDISIPELDENDKMYFSGRLPLWLLISLTRSYENSEKSAFQAGNKFTKFSSKNPSLLGEECSELKEININKFFEAVSYDVKNKSFNENR